MLLVGTKAKKMPEFKTLIELESYLSKIVSESLQIDVALESRHLLREHIQTDVYEAYTPFDYIRTFETINSVITTPIGDDTIELTDTRRGDNDENIPYILEYGKGYSWGNNLDERIGPRPFMAETYKALAEGKVRLFMKIALKKRGIYTI